MYFRFVNSYATNTVMWVVQQLPFADLKLASCKNPLKSPLVQIGAALKMKGSLQSAVCSKLWSWPECADTPVIIIHVHIKV